MESKKPTKVAIVNSGIPSEHRLTTAKQVIESYMIRPLNDLHLFDTDKRRREVKIINSPLTDKQKDVIQAMANGALIEKVNGCIRCTDGAHVTNKSLAFMKDIGLIKMSHREGNYTIVFRLAQQAINEAEGE